MLISRNPLRIDSGLYHVTDIAIYHLDRFEEGTSQRRIGKIHLKSRLTLKSLGRVVGSSNDLDKERRLKILNVFADGLLLHARLFRQSLIRKFNAAMISYHREKGIQLLNIGNAIKARQISQQHLIHNVMAHKLARILLYARGESHLRVTTIIDVIDKEFIQPVNVYRAIYIALYPLPLHMGFPHQEVVFFQMNVFKEKQWRKIKIRESSRTTLITALSECRSGRTRRDKLNIVIGIH